MGRPARELVRLVCQEIAGILPCDQIMVALPPAKGGRVAYVIIHPEPAQEAQWSVPFDDSRSVRVLETGKAEICTEIGPRARFAEEPHLHDHGIREAAFLPLMASSRPEGVMILGAKRTGALDVKSLRVLERARGLVAAALSAAQALPGTIAPDAPDTTTADPRDRSIALSRQIAEFSRASARIVQENDLQVVCRLFLETVREYSGFRRAVLTLVDEQGRDHQWFFTGLSDSDIDHFHTHKMTAEQRGTLLQDAYRAGSSYRVPVATRRTIEGIRPPSSKTERAPSSDLLMIPLHGAGSVLVGTVMLDDFQRSGWPKPEAVSCLELFASQMAHAVEKKRLEQAVRNAQSRLRSAQEQLMQAEKMSAIGQLISGVAHELNNPLSGVMGFSQLLLAGEVEPKVRKHLERIFNETVRCQRIVQNLLTFARRHKPEKASHSLNEVIDSVLELRAYQLQVDNVEVERRYDASLPSTMLDFHQIQQVVLNVVNNAHQAMMATPGRPRHLVVTTEAVGGALRARFRDSGTGIAQERLGKIFEPFFTTKEAGKGTGLGLSLSRSIVREHQGTISANSVLGEGTTISVELPIIEGAMKAAKHAAAPQAVCAPLQPLRLLVVDDEEVLTELLGDFLEGEGHTVARARDGKMALQLALANDFDAILTDLKMPGLDGQGLFEQVCRTKPQMRQRFIFSTGDLANPRVQTFFQSNGCLYLSKPFKLESVLAALDQLLRRQRAA